MVKKVAITAFIFFIGVFLFLLPKETLAVHSYHCGAERPASAPTLVSATAGNESVILTWLPAQDPVTYYLVQYGPAKDQLIYGLPNIGDRESTSFTVDHLVNGVRYYFQVRAGNDCKPGDFSHTLSAVPGGVVAKTHLAPNLSIHKQVLGASTSALLEKKASEQKKKPVVLAISKKGHDICDNFCIGKPLLALEVLFLITFFYLAKKVAFIKPFAAIFIPLILNVIFYKFRGVCSSSNFFCSYFLPLSVIFFILIIIIQKHRIIQRHTNFHTV